MPFDARVLQVLIASPGDVNDERKLLSEVISEWNYVNARERRVVLLPLRWETHASPELGASPQAVINRQIVDSCDLAVGVFWTRLGTPTAAAESGTAEEISRVGGAGKPVMLYFSKAKVDLDTVDLAEYGRLREFKEKTYPQGFVEHYESLADFREKFTRQLAIKVLEIFARDVEKSSDDIDPRARLSLELLKFIPGPGYLHEVDYPGNSMDLGPGMDAQEHVTSVSAKRLMCTDPAEIPDFGEQVIQESLPDLRIGFKRRFNHNFFRQVVEYSCRAPVLGPFRLAVTASQEHGLRDIYIEIRVSGLGGDLVSQQPEATSIPEPYTLVRDQDSSAQRSRALTDMSVSGDMIMGNKFNLSFGTHIAGSRLLIDKIDDVQWLIRIELPAIQAGRTVHSANTFWIIAERECKPSFDATIYSSDTTPFASHVGLEIEVEESTMPYQKIVGQFMEHHPLPD